jgi:hypothetical protein
VFPSAVLIQRTAVVQMDVRFLIGITRFIGSLYPFGPYQRRHAAHHVR